MKRNMWRIHWLSRFLTERNGLTGTLNLTRNLIHSLYGHVTRSKHFLLITPQGSVLTLCQGCFGISVEKHRMKLLPDAQGHSVNNLKIFGEKLSGTARGCGQPKSVHFKSGNNQISSLVLVKLPKTKFIPPFYCHGPWGMVSLYHEYHACIQYSCIN